VRLDLELDDAGPAKRRAPRDAKRLVRQALPSKVAPPYRGGLLAWLRIASVPSGKSWE